MTTHMVSPERGSALRAARRAAGVGLRELARQAGVSPSHLTRFETGERPISLGKYEHLIAALSRLMPTQDGAA